MKFKGGLCFVLGFVFLFAFVSAEFNLIMTASFEDSSTDVFIQTNDLADVGFDIYDLEYPPFPVSSPKLFSVIEDGNRELIMDSWKEENRGLKLVYSRGDATLGNLRLGFNGDISSKFRVVLHDYGRDSEYVNEVGASLITGSMVYNVNSSEKKRYFLLDVDYLFCGDGICSEDESCSVCSVDCSGCGSAGTLDPFYFLTVSEVENGYSRDFSFDEGYKFNFKNEVHSVKIVSITGEGVKVLIASTPFELDIRWDEEREVDIDSDSVSDFVLKPTLSGDGVVNLYFIGLAVGDFGEVLDEDRKVYSGRVSVFDKVYGEGNPIWIRILVTVGILVVGLGLMFFAFFILRAKVKSKGTQASSVTSFPVGPDVPSSGIIVQSYPPAVAPANPAVQPVQTPVQPVSPANPQQPAVPGPATPQDPSVGRDVGGNSSVK